MQKCVFNNLSHFTINKFLNKRKHTHTVFNEDRVFFYLACILNVQKRYSCPLSPPATTEIMTRQKNVSDITLPLSFTMPILLFSHRVLTPSENVIVHWSTLQWLHLKYILKVNALHLETRLAIDSLSGFLTKAWKWSNYLLCVEMNCKPPWFTSYPNYYSSLYLQQQNFHPAYFVLFQCSF